MNGLALCFVMAILSQQQAVLPQDTLTKPQIALSEQTGVYWRGENISITCTGHKESGNSTFYLYRDKQILTSPRIYVENNSAIFTVNASNPEGGYQCQYGREISGEWIKSPRSRDVRIIVTDRPPKPTIYIYRQVKVFVKGERMKLVCVARTPTRGHYFYLYRGTEEESAQFQRAESWSLFVIFEVQDIVEVGTQEYTCSYWRRVSGREIFAERSDPVAVTVIERPTKPRIAPEGKYRVFVDGELVRVTCTAPSPVGNATFHLYQGGEKKPVASETSQSANSSATFDITNILGVAIKHYACGYVTSVSERLIESERSDSVKIVVEIRLVRPYLYFQGVTRTLEVGESARLVCQGAFEDRDSTFYLYKDSQEEALLSKSPRDMTFHVAFDIRDTLINGTEYYSCAYRRRLTQRTVLSGRSNSLAITAHNPLTKPELILNVQTGKYWKGQVMTMTCEGDVREPDGYFYFYRDGQPAYVGEPHSFQTVSILGPNRVGIYQCKYAMDAPGKWFESPFSDGVRVTEIGDLPRPTITLEGGHKMFEVGQSVTVTCEAPSGEAGRKFYLYQSTGMRPVMSEKAKPWSLSVTFDIKDVMRRGDDYYTCAYRRREAEEEKFSQRSDPLKVSTL
ncbi:alpha-1B-glycoprotein-like [Heptranchias perlo]|uniref:alpha-1B-glycoprotein-like n=1 Tax=Heptranchias perlo TaxID=212740 RepID=UPI00355AC16A